MWGAVMRRTSDRNPEIFTDLLEKYLNQLTSVCGYSGNTVKSYKDAFAVLFEYLEDKMGIANDKVTFSVLTYDVIINFLDYLEAERNCSILTRNQRRAVLSSFAKYASQNNFSAAGGFFAVMSKIPRKRGRGKKKSFFSLEEVQIILSLPDLHTLAGRRDSILLVFMYYTGTRAQEVCDLKVRDIAFVSGTSAKVSIHGKGNKTRILPLPPAISKMLIDYLKYQGIYKSYESHVFSSQTHEQMSISCVEEIYKKYVAIAKEQHQNLFLDDNYTPHSMRHSTAVHMLEAGVSLPKIQRFLGHSSIATTQIYAEITQKSLDKTLEEWNTATWSHLKNLDDNLEENHRKPTSKRPSFLR